jgi:hypothetical protein
MDAPQGTPAPRQKRDAKATANEATGQRAELTPAAKAALAAASRDRGAAPARMGAKERVDAVAALIDGGSGDDRPASGNKRQRSRAQDDGASGAVDEVDGVDDAQADEGGEHRGQDDEGDQGDENEDEGKHDDDATPTLDDLAAHAGLSTADLNKLPVKLGAGVTLTLGEMKGRWSELVKLDETRAEFEDRKQQQELDAIDAHRRIRAIVDAFPAGSVPPQVMARINAQHNESMAREADLLHKARPEWRDAKYAAAQRDSMYALGKKYGFSQAELASIPDHRQVLLLQDFARALARQDAAKAAARRVEPGTDKRPGAETQRAAIDTTRRGTGSRKQEVSSKVARLIQG